MAKFKRKTLTTSEANSLFKKGGTKIKVEGDERFIVRTQEESKEKWAKFKREHPERFGD